MQLNGKQCTDRFVEYILDEYVLPGCRFPPATWATFDAHQIRTTNACEAHNGKLKKMFYHAHPNIFVFAEVLLEIQEMSYLKMRNPTPADPSVSTILEQYMAKLEAGEISRFDFVHDLARKFLPPKMF